MAGIRSLRAFSFHRLLTQSFTCRRTPDAYLVRSETISRPIPEFGFPLPWRAGQASSYHGGCGGIKELRELSASFSCQRSTFYFFVICLFFGFVLGAAWNQSFGSQKWHSSSRRSCEESGQNVLLQIIQCQFQLCLNLFCVNCRFPGWKMCKHLWHPRSLSSFTSFGENPILIYNRRPRFCQGGFVTSSNAKTYEITSVHGKSRDHCRTLQASPSTPSFDKTVVYQRRMANKKGESLGHVENQLCHSKAATEIKRIYSVKVLPWGFWPLQTGKCFMGVSTAWFLL
jgi:hypothetical protein